MDEYRVQLGTDFYLTWFMPNLKNDHGKKWTFGCMLFTSNILPMCFCSFSLEHRAGYGVRYFPESSMLMTIWRPRNSLRAQLSWFIRSAMTLQPYISVCMLLRGNVKYLFTLSELPCKPARSRQTNKAFRQPTSFCWDLWQNESYGSFPFRSRCPSLLFWELESRRASAVSGAFVVVLPQSGFL